MQARIRRGVMFRELGNENTPGPPEPLLQLDQANPRGFRPLSALDKIDKDGLSFSEARDPGCSRAEMWTNTSLPPLSR